MPSKADWQSALTICGTIIGAGFASGREIVSFFSVFGSASWLGIAASSAGLGLLIYVILLLSSRTRTASFPALYGALMGQPCQDAMYMLHGLMCLMTAAAMLAAGAELGKLTFPVHCAGSVGFLITLLAGTGAVVAGLHSLSMLGALLIPLAAAYFVAMAVSGGSAVSSFSADHLLASVPMGLIYASFNAALAGGTVCLCGQTASSPGRTARLAGGILFLLLCCANFAFLNAGQDVLAAALPSVVLSARWGVSGYYASILVLWLAILTTLCAMLHSLCAQLTHARLNRSAALLLTAALASLLSATGFHTLVELLYPLLGWLCSFVLVALLLYLPEDHGADA